MVYFIDEIGKKFQDKKSQQAQIVSHVSYSKIHLLAYLRDGDSYRCKRSQKSYLPVQLAE